MDTVFKLVATLLCFIASVYLVSTYDVFPQLQPHARSRYAFQPHKSGEGVYILDTYTGDTKLVGMEKVYEFDYKTNTIRVIPMHISYSIGSE